MEEYIVSARKYRPASFDTVVGQRALTTTLLNAIKTNKLAHAYLFCGPRGVGKTTCARIFAKTINCMHPNENGEACNECESCRAFDEGRSLNIHELDAASNNSVENIRELIQQVQIPPQTGRYKVFIIDEVHMLSTAAFNAFLKTLEEPPSYVIFVMATTEKHKILPTILSRCQVYDFARMTIQNTVDHLRYVAEKEGYTVDDESLNLIAQKADGGMRDALSIFDQMVSFTGGNITYQQTLANLNVLDTEYYFRLVDHFLKHEVEPCMLLLNEVINKGFDPGIFIGGLAAHMRDLMVSRDEQTLPLLEVSSAMRQRFQEQAKRCEPRFLYRTIKLCNDCDQNYRTSRNKRLQVEICLIQAAQPEDASAGRRPKTLAPLFNAVQTASEGQQSVAAANTRQATPTTLNVPSNTAANATGNVAANATSNMAANVQANNTPTYTPSYTQPGKPATKEEVQRPRLRTLTSFGPSILHPNLNEPAKTEQKKNIVQTDIKDKPIGKLNEHDLRLYWIQAANMLPIEHKAIAQRMEVMELHIDSETHFTFTVNNDLVKETFQEVLPTIIEHIRRGFNNHAIEYAINVSKIDATQKIITKEDIYNKMVEHNKAVQLLKDLLQLELV
ncbi:MAG: DNA polymerase III subunit gamma/tau [Bacteroidales bacterium]|nr:DNA polymerase III subunit gamma/tau [Bacteroidales bacterium]